jgi:uncharacterized protein YqcC (DUF446 family)
MSKRTESIRHKLAEIEAELAQLGLATIEAPPPEAYENMGAFGINTMAFPQWLVHVFLARVKGLLESDGPWPESSMVGTQAIREFDGWPEASRLTTLLNEFDELFSSS